jgi:pimeloyl-ACP methyl ester carboxylesterase
VTRDPELPVAWEEGGEGRPVVLVHGFGASRFTWRRWSPALERRHRVLQLDLKGFGDAPRPRDGRYGPLDQADLLLEWIRRRDLWDATLVGHSLGGGIVLYAALRLLEEDPGRLRSLVIIAGAAYPQQIPKYIGLARLPILPRLALGLVPPRALLRRVLREISHPDARIPEEQVEGYAAPLDQAGTRYAILQAARQVLPRGLDEVVARYPRMTLPTLLLWGREDPVVPLSAGERLSRELPHAHLVVLERCGHLPQEERPAEGLAALLPFLGGD